jgi:hypothetical protein
MAKIKVFVGTKMVDGNQARVLVATSSKKRLSEIADVSMSHINNFFSVTANKEDIEKTMQNQETLIVKEWTKTR